MNPRTCISCLTLCGSMNHSLPRSSVHEILKARIFSELRHPPPGDLPEPGIKPASFMSPALAGRSFTLAPPEKPSYASLLYQLLHDNNIFSSCLPISIIDFTSILILRFYDYYRIVALKDI